MYRIKRNEYGTKWIGGSYPTLIGQLRYWYYNKRGWIYGNYYSKSERKDK